MKRCIYIVFLLFNLPVITNAQGILNDQPKMLFSNEQTFGAFLNSNGIGGDYRFAKQITVTWDKTYEASFDYVRDPKEYKTVVSYYDYTRRFVYGKENLFWELKGQIGRQRKLYRKYDFSSISIRMIYSGGISLGFQKPIYYNIINYNSTGQYSSSEVKKFDPGIHLNNYGGTASFTKGFKELKVIPGLTAKAGFNFEYSEREPMVHALEGGVAITVYPKNIEIMSTEKLHFIFFKMFVGYRFGTLLDISESSLVKSRKERRAERKKAQNQIAPNM